ncbi:MAG: diacylglycerol kinase family protein [Clostridia bacterium]|nr:diacylglycerol kinase family protein [Clostridia bacterium]
MDKYRKLFKSFYYAFRGIIRSIKTERNLRIHITCLIYMFSILGMTDWFTLSRTDWAVLILTSGTVIAAEIVNTAIENAVNLASEEYHKFAEISKDAAAGAVLISVIFAVSTGIAILFQPEAFKAMYDYFASNILHLIILVTSIIPATYFIFFGFSKPKGKKNE